MIRCPIFPESRTRSFCAAVALIVLLVALLLAAGCNDVTQSHAQDLVIVKLNHDGSTAWAKTIESGKKYRINDALQTSDGGYALGGISSTPLCNSRCKGYDATIPTIIRLSDNGEVLSELGFQSEIKDRPGTYMIMGLVQTPDSGYYAISGNGLILSINPNGTISRSRVLDTNLLNRTEIVSVIRTHDGGSVISGFTVPCELDQSGVKQCPTSFKDFKTFVEKLDRNGITTWSRSYADSGFFSGGQIIELNHDKGYTSVMEHNSNNSLVMLDRDGMIVNSSGISLDGYEYNLLSGTNDFSILIHRNVNYTFPVLSYDYNGIKTESKLINFTGNPDAIIGTSDSGYLSVNKDVIFLYGRGETTNISVRKMTDNGEPVWNRQISSFVTESRSIQIWNVIETSDNGYLIVLGIEERGS